jgi:hypothetical protein
LISDNARSEVGEEWTKILREYKVRSKTSEPHHPHQNPAESEWGRLGNMIKNVLRQSRAPIELCHWTAIYCCQINDHLSRRSLKYKTPLEVSTGCTPDISHFRFSFYEPIWFFEPKIKLPKHSLLKARYLAVAESCGDAMTYYILTEPDDLQKRRQVLMRSVIKSRRKNVGTETEYVNDNPSMESFTLSLAESASIEHSSISSSTEIPLLIPGEKIGSTELEQESPESQSGEKNGDEIEIIPFADPQEQLPPDFNITNDAESFQQIAETTNPNLDGDCSFRKIMDHSWDDGKLTLKVQYVDSVQGTFFFLYSFLQVENG